MPTESKPIELGVACPNFDLPSVDGKNHKLEDFAQSKVLIVAFTCNHCPYVQAYESRMIEFAKTWKDRGVAFICINANDAKAYPEDSFTAMQERAKKLGFTFYYLHDFSQQTARAFNAACTPEFYVYDESRKLRYHGRFDDNQKDPSAVKHQYLADAVSDLLAGKPVRQNQTSAIGCSIKWRA